jgi:universal stress protein A
MNAKPNSKSGGPILGAEVAGEQSLARTPKVAAFAPPLFRLNKILVPIDFSEVSKKALGYAVQFAEPKSRHIVLLHIVERRPRRERDRKFDHWGGSRMDEAERKLLELGEHELGLGSAFDLLVEMGQPFREIVNAAKALSVDLIVMAADGRSRHRHALGGRTAEQVVRHAPCPILVVREREHELFKPQRCVDPPLARLKVERKHP